MIDYWGTRPDVDGALNVEDPLHPFECILHDLIHYLYLGLPLGRNLSQDRPTLARRLLSMDIVYADLNEIRTLATSLLVLKKLGFSTEEREEQIVNIGFTSVSAVIFDGQKRVMDDYTRVLYTAMHTPRVKRQADEMVSIVHRIIDVFSERL
jgi:hypothetical protein